MKATFKSLQGFDRYTISNKGRIYDKKMQKLKRNRVIVQKGRKPVVICDLLNNEGKKTSVQINQVVASHFCNNPKGFKNVYYKDGNYLNNNAYNLVYLDFNDVVKLKGKRKNEGRKAVQGVKNDTIKFLSNLSKRGKNEDLILRYYEVGCNTYLWEIFKLNYQKLESAIKIHCDKRELIYEAFDYYIDRVNRFTVNNYQFKILLDCIKYKESAYLANHRVKLVEYVENYNFINGH